MKENMIQKKILGFSILAAMITLIENFCVSFFSCWRLIYLHRVRKIAVPVLQDWEGKLIACIGLAAVLLVICGMAKRILFVLHGKTRKWYLALALPLLAITLVIYGANLGASKGILVRSGGNMGLYYDQLFSYGGICVLSALSMFAAGFYVFGMDQIYLEQKKSSQYHEQIAAYRMLEEQDGQTKRLRHDLKNHLAVLSGLAESGEWEKLKEYLKNMGEAAQMETGEEATGNQVVDILLNQKRKMAERKNAAWECDVKMPRECHIQEFDLCVLFGNILDNAVEACGRQQEDGTQSISKPFIQIRAGTVKKCFLLEVKNSADREGQYKTGAAERKNPKEYGIGLLNVRDVVHKYNGTMNIEIKEGIFVISVLIPLESNEGSVHDMKRVN